MSDGQSVALLKFAASMQRKPEVLSLHIGGCKMERKANCLLQFALKKGLLKCQVMEAVRVSPPQQRRLAAGAGETKAERQRRQRMEAKRARAEAKAQHPQESKANGRSSKSSVPGAQPPPQPQPGLTRKRLRSSTARSAKRR